MVRARLVRLGTPDRLHHSSTLLLLPTPFGGNTSLPQPSILFAAQRIGSRMGRQPNAVKHAISLEARKQNKEHSLQPPPDRGNRNSCQSPYDTDTGNSQPTVLRPLPPQNPLPSSQQSCPDQEFATDTAAGDTGNIGCTTKPTLSSSVSSGQQSFLRKDSASSECHGDVGNTGCTTNPTLSSQGSLSSGQHSFLGKDSASSECHGDVGNTGCSTNPTLSLHSPLVKDSANNTVPGCHKDAGNIGCTTTTSPTLSSHELLRSGQQSCGDQESTSAAGLDGAKPTEVGCTAVKQEAEDLDELDPEMMSGLLMADKELVNISVVERAKSGVINKAVFQSVSKMWTKQMEHFEFHVKCTLRFVKKIPGFRLLDLDDQAALVQSAIYPINVLNHARTYEAHTGFYNYFNLSKPEEHALVELVPEFRILQTHFRYFGEVAHAIGLDPVEYTLLSCLLLLNPDCPGLTHPQPVSALQDRLLLFFQNYEKKQRPDGLKRLGQMLLRISELTLANQQHGQTMAGFLASHPDLTVPQLFTELFL